MTRIVELHVENFMGCELVDITPPEHVVTIGGKNAAGKSSVLNAILAALGGAKSIPPMPVRDGAEDAVASVRLSRPDGGDMIVTRVFTDDGKTSLNVTSADGAKYSKPQALLDGLLGAIGFDPFAFTRLPAAKQAQALRDLVGVDVSDLESQRQDVYEQRASANREVKRLEGVLASLPEIEEGTPDEAMSVSELVEQLQRLNRRNAEAEEKNREVERRLQSASATLDAADRRREALLAELKAVEEKQLELSRTIAELRKFEPEPLADTSGITEAIAAAERDAERVRKAAERREVEKRLSVEREASDDLTQQISNIDAEKADRLAKAPWPVPGLGFDGEGVTYRGRPFGQASSAEQLRVSLAIGMAANPKLKVLAIRDGSLIDEDTMAVIREQVESNDFQLWIEKVTADGKGCSLVISEGRGVAVEQPAMKKRSKAKAAT